jgi:hypothetical protein
MAPIYAASLEGGGDLTASTTAGGAYVPTSRAETASQGEGGAA